MPVRPRAVWTHVHLWLPPLVYAAAIFSLSAQSNPLPTLRQDVWDKLLHAIEYGGLACLVGRALYGEGVGWLAAGLLAVTLASAYAASDEWHQAFVPGRESDRRDWIADSIGASLGAAGYAAVTAGLAAAARAGHSGRRRRPM